MRYIGKSETGGSVFALRKRASSNESGDTQYGVKWTVRGGGSGQKWFSTDDERGKFIDKLAEKYGGYEVLDVSYSDPR